MRRAAFAVVASVGVHALFAAALAVYLAHAPGPEVLASLDVSSVELSFAEKDDDVQALSPMPPSMPSTASPQPEDRPPEPPRAEVRPMPPDQGALGARPPESEIAKMEGAAAAVPQEAPRQARIDAPPRPKKAIRPHYPDGARRRGEQGDVVLEIRVEEDGSVGDVKVVATSGFGELDDAAVRAVRAARFAPARSGDDAVASTARLALSFRIRN